MTPAKEAAINLLPKDPFEDSFWGRFLKWALSVGRYIVVATELIVVLSFLSRFKLDRDLTDLNEAVALNQAVLESYRDLEKDYRLLAKRLETINQLQGESLSGVKKIDELVGLTPVDVFFSRVTLNEKGIELTGTALSDRGLRTLLSKLKGEDRFERISVTSIVSGGSEGEGIAFRVKAEVGKEKGK